MSTPRTRGWAILSTPPTADEFFSAILSCVVGGNNSVQRLRINRNSISIYLIFGNSFFREFLRLCIFNYILNSKQLLYKQLFHLLSPSMQKQFYIKFIPSFYVQVYVYHISVNYFVSMITYVSSQTRQYIYKCMLH